jgi:methanogenic corrinoid protein MtbC1
MPPSAEAALATAGRVIGEAVANRRLEDIATADRLPVFNTAAVARRTGLLPTTFRAWERRYGFPAPHREPGNRRSYSEQDVQALEWLRDRLAEGLTISTALSLLRRRLAQPEPRGIPASGRPPAELTSELERLLLDFDERGAEAILSESFALYSVEQVCLEVIEPALRAIGDGWRTGVVDVAQEHFSSALIRRRLTELLRLTTSARASRLVVTACAPDDWHELGVLIVSLFLARRGWRTVYLGASVPADDLFASIERLRPDAVALSATMPESAAALADLAARFCNRPPPHPLFAFGGRIFETEPGRRDAIPGLYLGPNATTAVERLEQAFDGGAA